MSTPVVRNSSEVPNRAFEQSAIDALVVQINESLGSDEIMGIFEDGFTEAYTPEEREAMDPDVAYGKYMHGTFARALLRAAEEHVIQALGWTED